MHEVRRGGRGGQPGAWAGQRGARRQGAASIRILQGIADRHGVRLDRQYGGWREWRGLVRAVDAQVELEREGQRRRYICHCWPKRCHGQSIATEVAWRAKAQGGEWRRRRAEGVAGCRHGGARSAWRGRRRGRRYTSKREGRRGRAGRGEGAHSRAAKRPRPMATPGTPQTVERLGGAGPQVEGPSVALPASLADGHGGGGGGGGSGGETEAEAFLQAMSEEMAADRATAAAAADRASARVSVSLRTTSC